MQVLFTSEPVTDNESPMPVTNAMSRNSGQQEIRPVRSIFEPDAGVAAAF